MLIFGPTCTPQQVESDPDAHLSAQNEEMCGLHAAATWNFTFKPLAGRQLTEMPPEWHLHLAAAKKTTGSPETMAAIILRGRDHPSTLKTSLCSRVTFVFCIAKQ